MFFQIIFNGTFRDECLSTNRFNVVEEIAALKEMPGHEIQIEGSATLVQSLAEADLIDEYRFLVHPIVMGGGRRFFKDDMHTGGLKLVQARTLDLGVVLLCYTPFHAA
jgi:dihydrofolate reductase